jgi:hypothetical protein
MAFYIEGGRRREVHDLSAPLGYVFWHWPRPGVSQRRYEGKLVAFQSSLKAHGPDGLVEALSFRVHALPWAKAHPGACEDWYVVRDFGTLGALNEAAVDEFNGKTHDDVAMDASGGAGGVYKLLRGDFRLGEARFATWLRKPARTTYQTFLEGLSKSAGESKTDLWQRQLVLGPTPEFCLHSVSRLDLPRNLRSTTVRVRLVGAMGETP